MHLKKPLHNFLHCTHILQPCKVSIIIIIYIITVRLSLYQSDACIMIRIKIEPKFVKPRRYPSHKVFRCCTLTPITPVSCCVHLLPHSTSQLPHRVMQLSICGSQNFLV